MLPNTKQNKGRPASRSIQARATWAWTSRETLARVDSAQCTCDKYHTWENRIYDLNFGLSQGAKIEEATCFYFQLRKGK